LASPFHCSKCNMGFDSRIELKRHEQECRGIVNSNVVSSSTTDKLGRHHVVRVRMEAKQ